MARNALIEIRRGSEANLTSGTLADGELGYTTDTKKLFVGYGGQNICLGGANSLGDMLKSIYDTNNDGIVDNAEKLQGHSASYFQMAGSYAPSSHTHTKSQITDMPASLPANGGNADTLNGLNSQYFWRPFSQGRCYQDHVGGSTDLGWKKLFRMTGTDRSGNGTAASSNNYYDAGTIMGIICSENGNYYCNRMDKYQFQFTLHSWSGTSRQDVVKLYVPSGMPDILRVVKYGTCDYELQVRSFSDWLTISFGLFEVGSNGLTTYSYQSLAAYSGADTVVKNNSNKDKIIHEPLTWSDLRGI